MRNNKKTFSTNWVRKISYMSKFDIIKKITSNQSYSLLEEHLHEDFMLIREEGLVMRKEFLSYVKDHFEENGNYQIRILDLKLKFEDEVKKYAYMWKKGGQYSK